MALGLGHFESRLKDPSYFPRVTSEYGRAFLAYDSISNWIVYHFHDTSSLAPVRRQHAINDNEYLREDAANLASFLYRIRTTNRDIETSYAWPPRSLTTSYSAPSRRFRTTHN
jgi:hypothetical protein